MIFKENKMKILAFGTDRAVSKIVLNDLSSTNVVTVVEVDGANAQSVSGRYDVLYLDLLHIAMDEAFEAVVDQIDGGDLQVDKLVFLASAGMDGEVEPTWLEVQDLKELLLEVKYVAKLVDETERPYTILRPVEVQNEVQNQTLVVTPEGQPIVDLTVSEHLLAQVIKDAILTDQYLNQSVGISSKE
jgi:hypothetical protein